MKNVKFYLCLIEDDAMKAYGGMKHCSTHSYNWH